TYRRNMPLTPIAPTTFPSKSIGIPPCSGLRRELHIDGLNRHAHEQRCSAALLTSTSISPSFVVSQIGASVSASEVTLARIAIPSQPCSVSLATTASAGRAIALISDHHGRALRSEAQRDGRPNSSRPSGDEGHFPV